MWVRTLRVQDNSGEARVMVPAAIWNEDRFEARALIELAFGARWTGPCDYMGAAPIAQVQIKIRGWRDRCRLRAWIHSRAEAIGSPTDPPGGREDARQDGRVESGDFARSATPRRGRVGCRPAG